MPADQKKDTLWGTLQGIVDTHHNIIANFVGNMVSGKAVYLGAFSKQIENGKWLTNNLGDKNLYDLEKNYKTAFSALLLADAWKLAYKSTPVVLMVDKQCDLSKPVREMTDDALQSGGSCVAGGKTLFLVGYNSDSCKSAANVLSPGSPVPCATGVFNKLPGFDNLGDYGLAKDNILASVWDAYQLNGGKNGYKFDPNTKIIDGIGTQSNMVLGGGIQTPGLYNIPICEVNEAVENYRNNLGGRLCDYGS
jgi:hypothetical protein